MAATTENRTTSWLNSHNFRKNVKEEEEEMTEAPLDFSNKKRHSSPDEDSMSDAGTSTSSNKRVDSPPSMADFNSLQNPLAFPQAYFPQMGTGNLPSFPFATLSEPRNKNVKPVRPFKAYPREPMQFPMNLWMLESLKPGLFGPDAFSQYKRAAELAIAGRRTGPITNGRMARAKRKVKTVDCDDFSSVTVAPVAVVPSQVTSSTTSNKLEKSDSTSHSVAGSPRSQNGQADSTAAALPTPSQVNGSDRSDSKTPESHGGPQSKNRPRSISDEVKDAAYWERRRKNNEAAKRSRDSRRAKEDEIALRAGFLENENLQLRVQIEALRAENAKFRSMLILN